MRDPPFRDDSTTTRRATQRQTKQGVFAPPRDDIDGEDPRLGSIWGTKVLLLVDNVRGHHEVAPRDGEVPSASVRDACHRAFPRASRSLRQGLVWRYSTCPPDRTRFLRKATPPATGPRSWGKSAERSNTVGREFTRCSRRRADIPDNRLKRIKDIGHGINPKHAVLSAVHAQHDRRPAPTPRPPAGIAVDSQGRLRRQPRLSRRRPPTPPGAPGGRRLQRPHGSVWRRRQGRGRHRRRRSGASGRPAHPGGPRRRPRRPRAPS